MYGVLAAGLYHYKPRFWHKRKNFLFGIGLLFLLLYYFSINRFNIDFFAIFNPSIIALGTALILPFLTSIKQGQGFLYKFITYFSLTSYSIYLINLSIVQDIFILNFIKLIPQNWPISIIASIKLVMFFGVSFFGSIVLYKFFELPFMKIRDRKN